jgi:membrane-bound lytic murein transglycosylase D
LVPTPLGGLVLLLLVWCHAVLAEPAPSSLFPLPDALRPNVTFWKRVFAVLDTNGGLLHDMEDVTIVYHIWYNDLPSESGVRQALIDEARSRYRAILTTLADGKRLYLTPDEERVWAMFKGKQDELAFRAAAENMRYQGGMRSRFAQGLVRSWTHMPEIERIFAAAGLPAELTLLPHIESSFENRALSKVGAAGIWQIMPATGRRYLRISGDVDERLNIRAATTAAAQILQENYTMLGTWPLAITAYNHGPYGMKQAVALMGTKDFGVIVQRYRGPLFGFASQNFYAEFLAAVDLVKNYKQYFGDILFEEPPRPLAVEARAPYDSRPGTSLAQLGTAQRPSPGEVPPLPRSGAPLVSTPMPAMPQPRPVEPSPAVQASLPAVATPWPAAPRPSPGESPPVARTRPLIVSVPTPVAPTPPPGTPPVLAHTSLPGPAAPAPVTPPALDREYRVRPGETLSSIAQRHGTTVTTLVEMNGLSRRAGVKAGQTILLPPGPALVASADKTAPKGAVAPDMATVKTVPASLVHRTVLSEVTRAPVPPQAPGAPGARLPELHDRFQVKKDTIRVAPQEQLSQYADWLDMPVQRLLTLNRLSARQALPVGATVRLDFSKVSAAQFTQQRLQYHRSLEIAFLRRHRVDEVVTRKLKPGETLMSVSRQAPGVPLWLLHRYNTHLDLNAPSPGAELRIPKVVSRVS